MRFKELPVGARFEFRGHRYEKVAISMARDEERRGNIFHDDTEVVSDTPVNQPATQEDAPTSEHPGSHEF